MKIVKIGLIVLLAMLVLNAITKKDELRIRVIANSDNQYDQAIKYQVVSIVKSVIRANDTKEEIVAKLDILDEKVSSYLSHKNIDYTIDIADIRFPPKELNGQLVPGGIYESLVIIIGEGQGKNWWSLLYPEYFNVTFEDIESGDVILKSYFYDLFK